MSGETQANRILNLEGLLCPIPIVKISQAIKDIPINGIIEATATDPGVLVDIPAWTRTTGNEVIKIERDGKLVRFSIRRLK
jgi:tRNA 2-thiouridine synthesizing protein A